MTIETKSLPLGLSLGAALTGEDIPLENSGFYTSEDGNEFVLRLEMVAGNFTAHLRELGLRPSVVDNLLVIVSKDSHATVYCNELSMHCQARRRVVHPHAVPAGTALTLNDITAIETVELRDSDDRPVIVPDDAGVVFVFSHGWRKAIFFDFRPLHPELGPRRENLPRLFGRGLTQLMFQELYSAGEEQWSRLLRWGWFPFIGLTRERRRNLLDLACCDRYMAPMMEEMAREFCEHLEGRLENWVQHDLLRRQRVWLELAVRHYRGGDYPSCIAVLYPRIEGMMRALYGEENSNSNPCAREMVENLVENHSLHSTLMPERFGQYLREVYFRSFDVAAGDVALSRNSHAHGVSDVGEYDLIRAAVGFMIVDQMAYYLTD